LSDQYHTFLVLNDPSEDYSDSAVLEARIAKIKACPDRDTQLMAWIMLAENLIHQGAVMATEGFAALAESGEEISEEAAEAMIELVGLVLDSPEDFRPGDRVVLDLDDMPDAEEPER
jgi:hypothetical protein